MYVLDEPRAIEKKIKSAVTDSGTEIRRGEDKPGVTNLIEILAVARASTPEAVEAELADARGYGDLKAAVAEATVAYLAPVRERYTDLRADEDALEAVLVDGAARARGIAAGTLADVRERMGVGRREPARWPSCVIATVGAMSSVATLDLDLDVFSGPFDLLLTLVLREEIDLLELALADVVLSYLDHLEARGELDLETATEFIVLIAALLELKSKLMLASEDDEELLEMEPEEAAEELLARMLDARRYRSAAGHLQRAARRTSTAPGFAKRRRPRTCAAPSSRPRRALRTPTSWARRSDGC